MKQSFTLSFTAQNQHIDELGHVNNAVWVQWIQDMASAHWNAKAEPHHLETIIWMVTRHEIDYRSNIKLGESAVGATWIEKPPRGARFERRVDFTDSAGKVIVSANSVWAMVDKETHRLLRVREEVYAPFYNPDSK